MSLIFFFSSETICQVDQTSWPSLQAISYPHQAPFFVHNPLFALLHADSFCAPRMGGSKQTTVFQVASLLGAQPKCVYSRSSKCNSIKVQIAESIYRNESNNILFYDVLSLFKTDWGKPIGAPGFLWHQTSRALLLCCHLVTLGGEGANTWNALNAGCWCYLPLRHSKQVMSGAGVGAKRLQDIVSYLWSAWIE